MYKEIGINIKYMYNNVLFEESLSGVCMKRLYQECISIRVHVHMYDILHRVESHIR